jgi:hypothetical protein
MLHDRDLLDRLAAFSPVRFDGEVYRATRRGLDPLAPSSAGGRWMPPDLTPTLYTSCERDGAIAEIAFHWSQLSPMPSKPAMLHQLAVRVGKTLRLGRPELVGLGVDWSSYDAINSSHIQAIGAAVAHLEYHGLIAPSARWACDNVILFVANHDEQDTLALRQTEQVDWRGWMEQRAQDRQKPA